MLHFFKKKNSSFDSEVVAPKRDFERINLTNDYQMSQAVKEPNGGLQLGLDSERLYYIRVFIENDIVRSYSIDKEAASDSHYSCL